MKDKIIKFFKDMLDRVYIKLIIIALSIFVLTGTDLFVKQIVHKNIQNKPRIIIIKKFWSFDYVRNYDIGFSLLRGPLKKLSVPKKINIKKFDEKILKKLENKYDKQFIERYYHKDSKNKNYILLDNVTEGERYNINRMLREIDFRTAKWFVLVILQLSASILVILFFFKSKMLRHLIPLGLIIGGALGNVFDRIIRGYVVDYIRWDFWFFPDYLFGIQKFSMGIFKPWPIFNLADAYTVIGTFILFIIVFFFTKEEQLENKNKLK